MPRLALLALLTLPACAATKSDGEPMPEAPPSATTRWVPALPASGLSFMEGPARSVATPNASAVVSVPLGARVMRVRVVPGQRVAAGEPLVDVIMPELIRAAGSLRAADIRLAALTQRRGKLVPLLEQGLARAAEVAELDAAIASARADRESARATMRAAGESDAHALALIDGSGRYALRAPLAGMVVAVSAQLGQVREPGGGPLVELVGPAALQVEARFTSEPPAEVRFEWIELARRLPLALEAVSPRAAVDGTRTAWLHALDSAAAPAAGVLGRVRMVAPDTWQVVPVRALREHDGALTVRVQREQGSAEVPVTLVRRSETEAVITGLSTGTLVAADATLAGELP
ncbi:MAG: uncharacterized protein JWN48_468 [Myxococcaceae bacterium]|nr:uncharacterized protein [Myxococcaceae bacterium]